MTTHPSPFLLLPDPWMAACLHGVLPDAGLATFGFDAERRRLRSMGDHVVVVEPRGEQSAVELLDDPAVRAAIPRGAELLTFKPSARTEEQAAELGATVLLAPAELARALENKLVLQGLAEEAAVLFPPQINLRSTGELSWDQLTQRLGPTIVAQSPRGFMGRRTFLVDGPERWAAIVAELGERPLKVARAIPGQPGTVNAVVDRDGHCVVTAPIVQVTGERWLTPFPLGSCGNDFTWRPDPHPGEGPALVAEALGRVLAAQGYRGHFGIDFVVEATAGGPRTWLIELNPRLTASFGLYSAWEPRLLVDHLRAVRGEAIVPARLPPIPGGQVIIHALQEGAEPLLHAGPHVHPPVTADHVVGPTLWPYPGPRVPFAGTRARIVSRGPVVLAGGAIDIPWRP